jgi:DNA-binding transcriptional regulator GbsR (MarR family)
MTPEVKQLKSQLSKMLNWNEARIDLLSRLLIALLKIKTVNLAQLARAFSSKAEESSS